MQNRNKNSFLKRSQHGVGQLSGGRGRPPSNTLDLWRARSLSAGGGSLRAVSLKLLAQETTLHSVPSVISVVKLFCIVAAPD